MMAKTAKKFKGANRYENFEIEKITRDQVHGADYNPRRISDSAFKKLKKFISSPEFGLLAPLTWNRSTGTLVSGHQRLGVLDALHRGKPYELTVAVVDMEEESEVKANVFMNNPSAQGEWDLDILGQLRDIVPDLDYEVDLGFEPEELEVMGLMPDIDIPEYEPPPPPSDSEKESFRDAKKAGREKAKHDNENGDGFSYSQGDFTLSVIFQSAEDKRSFLESVGMNPNSPRVPSKVITDLLKS